jgi:uncharacterized protein
VSTGNYIVEYYSNEIFAEQLAWFDYWLKGIRRPEFDQPRVRLALQSSGGSPIWLKAQDWPLPDTTSRKLYLTKAASGALQMSDAQAEAGHVTYEAPGELPLHAEPILGTSDEDPGVTFQSETFREQTDIVGEVTLVLWAASSNDDMDLHVFLDLVSANGSSIELSRGWLKASHRELDPARTTISRPWHRHRRVLPLSPDKPERLDIEIWPMAVRVSPGESLRLRIAGRGPGFLSGWHRRPRGTHTVHFGGERPSRLVLPIITKQ